MVPIRVLLGLYWGYIGVIWGIMEKKMETTIMGSMRYGLNSLKGGLHRGLYHNSCRVQSLNSLKALYSR